MIATRVIHNYDSNYEIDTRFRRKGKWIIYNYMKYWFWKQVDGFYVKNTGSW